MKYPAQFTPAHFFELLEREREWFDVLIHVGYVGSDIATHHVQAMLVVLVERSRWLRN